jgi:disulfide bond formation protein DsbB
MDTKTGTLFLALLAVASQVTVGAALALAIFSRPTLARVRHAVGSQALQLAFVVALVATLGSLWLSEGAHFVPCRLCWYQRIAMYPLAILTTIAAARKDDLSVYVRVLASLGLVISAYHWLLERFPNIDAGVCSTAVPCELVWFEKFGFVTLPFMAFTAFSAILAVTTLPREDHR